jgi:phosphoribosylglycinamide formyltransferase 1
VKNIGVLFSGRGSNLFAIKDSIDQGRLDANMVCAISNRPGIPSIEAAIARGIATYSISSKGIAREEHDREVIKQLRKCDVELVCLAGYMRLVSAEFCRAFPDRIVNIHPSLLPAFPGLNAQKQALDHGVKITGCTVHFVNEELDAGAIILQAAIPVCDSDTEESLAARILKEEHRIYTEALRIVLSERWHIEGRRVIVDQ